MSVNFNNNNKPQTHSKRRIFFLIMTVILIVILVWQLSYHIPRIQKANEDVKISEEAVRLGKIWADCAQARVKAIEEGIQGPDCTTAKANALRAADAVTKAIN